MSPESNAQPSPNGVAVELRDLTKGYDGRPVLDAVNLPIAAGESLVLLGPSGGGKSVLLRQIMGLERPDGGSVLINGVDIASVGENAARATLQQVRVAMVFQGVALFDWLNVGRNVAFPIRHRPNWDEVKARVEDALTAVGLGGREVDAPGKLSGGQARRVAIARALVGEPRLVLYDEPTAGLDPPTRTAIAQLIRQTHDGRQTTTVTVTHDLETAVWIADRVVYLDSQTKQVQELVTPADIAQLCEHWEGNPQPAVPAGGRAAKIDELVAHLQERAGAERVFAMPQDIPFSEEEAITWSAVKARVEQFSRPLHYMGQLRPPQLNHVTRRVGEIGVGSLPFLWASALLVGMAMALQLAAAVETFGMGSRIPGLLTVSILREIAPLLAGLLIAGRSGAGIAAEVGAMKVSEQLDALRSFGVNPHSYLLSPLLAAALLVQPMLTLFFSVVSLLGGGLVYVGALHLRWGMYRARAVEAVEGSDLLLGLLKAIVFGAVIATAGYWAGETAPRGTKGVGEASRTAVVAASVLIIILDLVFSQVFSGI